MKKVNQISVLLLLLVAMSVSISSCGVFGKSGGRGCGCPSVYKKSGR